jgi:hypothetical protein
MKYQSNSIPHIQALLQFAQTKTQTKNCKRACLFATANFADTKKLNLLKSKKQFDGI